MYVIVYVIVYIRVYSIVHILASKALTLRKREYGTSMWLFLQIWAPVCEPPYVEEPYYFESISGPLIVENDHVLIPPYNNSPFIRT